MSLSAGLLIISMFADGAAATAPKPAKPASDMDKITCRKYRDIGSLTTSKKICHTQREWMQLNDSARSDNERMYQQSGHSRPNG